MCTPISPFPQTRKAWQHPMNFPTLRPHGWSGPPPGGQALMQPTLCREQQPVLPRRVCLLPAGVCVGTLGWGGERG